MMYDNGNIDEPPFKVINGKKVYNRFVGLNQPGEVI